MTERGWKTLTGVLGIALVLVTFMWWREAGDRIACSVAVTNHVANMAVANNSIAYMTSVLETGCDDTNIIRTLTDEYAERYG